MLANKKLHKYLVNIYLTIFVFCLIYSPRLYSFNTIHILFIISLTIFFFYYKEFIYVCKNSIIIKFCLSYFLLILYTTIIGYLGGERLTLTNFIIIPIELSLCILTTLSIMRKNNMHSKSLINIILICGIIQSLICCIMVISPEIRNSINEFRAQYWDDRLIGWATVRLLGFADGLFHTTPIIQAIISVLLIKKQKIIHICIYLSLQLYYQPF